MLARVTERARQQAISAHGEHHAGQAEQQHHDHGGQADHNAKTDDFGGPVSADHFECRGKRRIFLLGEVFVGDHAGGDDGDEGVKHDDQSHAHAYTQRNVLLRIDGFFGSGGDHIEAEEREEHERGSGDDAGNAVNAGGHAGGPLPQWLFHGCGQPGSGGGRRFARWNEWGEVLGLDVEESDDYHE